MKLLTLARDLSRRKSRERRGLFVAEGVRTLEELLRSPLAVRGAIVSPALELTPRGAELRVALVRRAVPLAEVSDADLESAAGTDTPQGVLAVVEQPSYSLATVAAAGRLLVLDAVQDPGNVGTLLRTAAAFGVHATLALPGTVDLWGAKVVRSAVGAHFRHPAFACSWPELLTFLESRSVSLWAADAGGEPVETALTGGAAVPTSLAIVVGNEGAGVSDATRARADRLVSIPISRDVESLNAAVAGAILLYALRPPAGSD